MPGRLLPILIIFPTPSHKDPLPNFQDNLADNLLFNKVFLLPLKVVNPACLSQLEGCKSNYLIKVSKLTL